MISTEYIDHGFVPERVCTDFCSMFWAFAPLGSPTNFPTIGSAIVLVFRITNTMATTVALRFMNHYDVGNSSDNQETEKDSEGSANEATLSRTSFRRFGVDWSRLFNIENGVANGFRNNLGFFR